MEKGSKNRTFAFDRFRIDTGSLMLYKDDVEVFLQPKAVMTLAVLVKNRGRIVSKDELIEQIWTDSFVEESNISQYIYLLRKTLGNRSDGKPYIETLKRRGYRFDCDVDSFQTNVADNNEPLPFHVHAGSTKSVEKDGNVLRVVEWEPKANFAPVIPIDKPARSYAWPMVAAASILVAVVTIAVFLLRSSPVSSDGEARNELALERLTNGIRPNHATISPDGQYFVYHEVNDGDERLFLQAVGQMGRIDITPMPDGTYGAKTFSSDGRFIYFLSAKPGDKYFNLFRMSTIGGAYSKILENVAGPISFSPDGSRFAFVRRSGETDWSLFTASSDGNDEREILKRSGSRRLTDCAAWSPDGGTIAFTEVDYAPPFTGGAFNIRLVSLSDGATRDLSDETWANAYYMVWTGDGEELITVGTRLGDLNTTNRDQIFSISRSDGKSRKLTTDGIRHQDWSLGVTRDDQIIYVSFDRSSQIWSMDATGEATTAKQITSGLADGRAGLVPLTDGRIAYITRAGENLSLWVTNGDGTETKQIVPELKELEELRGDPTGQYLVFSSKKDRVAHLFRVETDGQNLTQLTFGEHHVIDSAISPDGRWVVYNSPAPTEPTNSTLFRVSMDGGEPTIITKELCVSPSFSPNGEMLSCISGNEILILSATDGTKINSFKVLKNSIVNFGAPWLPDGKGLMFGLLEKGFSNVWIQPLNGGPMRRLTDFTSGDIYRYAFSHDGKTLYVARGFQTQSAVLMKNFRSN